MISIPESFIIYKSPIISTKFKKLIQLLFADDTASGRPCPFIDEIMIKKIIPFYSNTHSNVFSGSLMSKKNRQDTKFYKKIL